MSEWANRSFFLSKSLIHSFADKKSMIPSKNLNKIVFFGTFFVRYFVRLKNRASPSFLMSNVSESRWALTTNERFEQMAQVAHQKWATKRDLLRSLTKNEEMSKSLVFWANHSFAHYTHIFGERPERFAHITHLWWAPWVICSHRSLKQRE